jgi:serine/threonine-protein kinase
MKTLKTLVSLGLILITSHANAQWNNWGMPGSSSGSPSMMPGMPFGSQQQPRYQAPPQQPFGGMMPFGGQQQPRYQAPPQQPFGGMMPFGGQQQPRYQAPPQQPFGGMMPFGGQQQPRYQPPPQQPFGGMMPFGGQQQRYQAPAQQPFMMPGMDQGIRSMMQPGKIMAEEATPGMYMKPTWQ